MSSAFPSVHIHTGYTVGSCCGLHAPLCTTTIRLCFVLIYLLARPLSLACMGSQCLSRLSSDASAYNNCCSQHPHQYLGQTGSKRLVC